MTDEILWWGYLHSTGSLQLRRWFGNVGDYTTDLDGNNFVLKFVEPFPAPNRDKAMEILRQRLREQ